MEAASSADKPIAIVAPTSQKERIRILDSLRGFAILGILLMNIGSFSLPGIGHDPSVLSEGGINYKTWYFIELFPNGTQRALFSMLFGAGIILFVRSALKKTDGIRAADYFFRRQLWLIVFSVIDVFILLWPGDILLDYALLGMLMFTFRNLSPKHLLIAAGVCLLLMLARENRDLYKNKMIITRGETVAAMDTSVVKLTPKQVDQLGAMKQMKEESSLEKRTERMERIQRIIGRESYEDLYESRTERYLRQIVRYLYFELWDVLLFMFVGMAFFKMGILTGQAPARTYWIMLIIGLGLGLLLSYIGLQGFINSNYNNYDYSKNITIEFYQLHRVLRSLGIFALIMLLYKSGLVKWLFELLRPVGQMAFTNYLSQSILCGLIFYSIGFSMFGKLQRYEVYLVVIAIWIFQIILSNIWLRFFRFGPFEWAWRSLTYWKRQPFLKTNLDS